MRISRTKCTLITVCNGYERLTVLKMFSRLFCFEQVKALKKFSEKPYASRVEEIKEAAGDGRKVAFGT